MDASDVFDVVMNLDWNQVWREGRERTQHRWDGRAFWNARAPSFAEHARSMRYGDDLVALLQPSPDWTVLDVGCGAGTVAVPLASRVASITAVDISDRMLELLGKRCGELGITNVTPIRAGWEDDWNQAGIRPHDLVLASRSLFAHDLRTAVTKLTSVAHKRVMIVSMVGDGPYDRAVFDAVQRPLYRGPDFRFITGYLAQEGIFANVAFVREVEHPVYANLDEAVAGTRWMLDQTSDAEEEQLRAHLRARLVEKNGGWALPKPKVTHWAAIWWDIS